MIWHVKRRPMGRSFFRDAFPYFSRFLGVSGSGGSLWSDRRAEAFPFRTLKDARAARKKLHAAGERKMFIVRVKS